MSDKVAPAENGGRLLAVVPESLENTAERTLDDRVVDALGDTVLQTFIRAELGVNPEIPITKTGEPYSEAEIIEELSNRHNLAEDIATAVVSLKRYLTEHNEVE